MVQPPKTPMDPDLRDFYLEQYRQALENFRHWDQMAWTMMGLVSAAALGVLAWVIQDNSIHGGKLLALGIASIAAVWLFRLMFWGMSHKQDVLAKPAVEHFEYLFKSEQHLLKEPDSKGCIERVKGCLRSVRVNLCFLVGGYTAVWIGLICTSYHDC